MGETLRETIRRLTSEHLDAGHLVMGQCLTAVGWVGGTLPERRDMTELPMSDVAQSGFVTGAALVGRRPIYVVRYQGFQWFNAALIVNYAAKSQALWGRSCSLLIRSIAMEGGIGPTTGSSQHSLFTRMPGVRVFAPMTPGEWRTAYEEFMAGDDVVYFSEHRGAYDVCEEFSWSMPRPDIVLFPISITRAAALQAARELLEEEGIKAAVHPIWRLKPLEVLKNDLLRAPLGGIVLDDDFTNGAASAIALELHRSTGARMQALGLDDRTAGFATRFDNLPPDAARIKALVKETAR